MNNKYLDLNVFSKKTTTIIMPGGEKLEIEKPSARMYIEFEKFQNLENGENTDEEVMEALDDMCVKILSNNTEKKKISVEDLNFEMKFAIVRKYCEFLTETITQKN